MLSSRRVPAIIAVGACCAAVGAAVPVMAVAHGGHGARRGPSRWGNPVEICAAAGVPLTAHASGHAGYSGLSSSQLAALKTACEKLKPAYEKAQTSKHDAAATLQTSLQAASTKLDAACPPGRWRHHHWGPTGPTGPTGSTGTTGTTGPSGTCKKARETYRGEVHNARQKYWTEVQAAAKLLAPALSEFATTVKGILGPHPRHHRHRPWGPSGPGGRTGSSGPTGSTGATGAWGSHGPHGYRRGPRG